MQWGRTFNLIDEGERCYLGLRAGEVGDVMFCVSLERSGDLEMRVPREVVRELADALLRAIGERAT